MSEKVICPRCGTSSGEYISFKQGDSPFLRVVVSIECIGDEYHCNACDTFFNPDKEESCEIERTRDM